jgi:hypothetical protein
VILQRAKRVAGELGIAGDAAVTRDERDACRYQLADRISLGVELGGCCRASVRQRLRGEPGFIDQRAFDARTNRPPDAPRHHGHRDGQRDAGGRQRGDE